VHSAGSLCVMVIPILYGFDDGCLFVFFFFQAEDGIRDA